MNPEWIGYAAALLTTSAYIPQTIKVLKHRHTASLSLGMYVLISGGGACWFAYGAMIGSPSLMLTNGITLLMTLTILVMKLRHG